ncbi:MAG: hypothetical protein AAGA50_28550 [Pseudomonadota bacterium]
MANARDEANETNRCPAGLRYLPETPLLVLILTSADDPFAGICLRPSPLFTAERRRALADDGETLESFVSRISAPSEYTHRPQRKPTRLDAISEIFGQEKSRNKLQININFFDSLPEFQ